MRELILKTGIRSVHVDVMSNGGFYIVAKLITEYTTVVYRVLYHTITTVPIYLLTTS